MMRELLYWSEFHHGEGVFYLAATEIGLCHVALPNESFQSMQQWAVRYAGESTFTHDQGRMAWYIAQLKEYLEGRRKSFDIPLDLRGTAFQQAVWNALGEIPFSHTCTYGEVSAAVQRPSAVRAVGAAVGANPVPIFIPCHRVIGKNGTLTGYRGGLALKAWLLHLEGAGRDISICQ